MQVDNFTKIAKKTVLKFLKL